MTTTAGLTAIIRTSQGTNQVTWFGQAPVFVQKAILLLVNRWGEDLSNPATVPAADMHEARLLGERYGIPE